MSKITCDHCGEKFSKKKAEECTKDVNNAEGTVSQVKVWLCYGCIEDLEWS